MPMFGVAELVLGQALAFGKLPFDLLRGPGGEEKLLKNAKDACATEALEIATYTAIERVAGAVGDDESAKLASTILVDEERMLQRLLREIPKLTDAVVRADVEGKGSYDIARSSARVRRSRNARRIRSRPSRLLLTCLFVSLSFPFVPTTPAPTT